MLSLTTHINELVIFLHIATYLSLYLLSVLASYVLIVTLHACDHELSRLERRKNVLTSFPATPSMSWQFSKAMYYNAFSLLYVDVLL
jgi:hypothetical protein